MYKIVRQVASYELGKPCCEVMGNALSEEVFHLESDGLMHTEDDILTLNYCPFCGEKIALANGASGETYV